MAHLCLINPPGIKTVSGLQMHTPNPPIGLAYIAAAAREAGHRMTVIDATGEGLDQIAPLIGRPDILVQGLTVAEIVARIPADADLAGIGCTFSTLWPITREILAAIRAARPALPLIVGGEHASALSEHVLETSPADVCVIGEGEETLLELLNKIPIDGDLSAVSGIAYRRGDKITINPRRGRTRNIDELPWPAWDLFPIESYIERQQMNGIYQGRAMPILGTRGCPYSCTFCSSRRMWTRLYTMRDPAGVCDEIEYYQRRYGATDFHFQDLTAIVNRGWITAFCQELIRRGLKISWQLPSGTRCEAIDAAVCRLLAATGCKNLAYAPESGSERIRSAVQKRIEVKRLLLSVRAALRSRLSLSCFFVIGFPQDTPETLVETLRLVRKLALMGVHDVGVAKFVPYPGSELFAELHAAGEIRLDDAFFLSPIDLYGQRLHTSYCPRPSARQLHRWMLWLYLNFYVLSFLRHPVRTLRTLARAVVLGVEDTRYAKWCRDLLHTRRRWLRASREHRGVPQPTEAADLHASLARVDEGMARVSRLGTAPPDFLYPAADTSVGQPEEVAPA